MSTRMDPHVPTWAACLTSAMICSKQHEKPSVRKNESGFPGFEEAMITHIRRVRRSPGWVVEANQREIERAIRGVKGYRRGYWPARQDRKSRYSQGNSVSLAGRRRKLWGRASKDTNEWDRVNVVGKVPREFFRWLQEQTETDWVAREMLEQCLFEER